MKVLIDDVPYVPTPTLTAEQKKHAALDGFKFDSDAGDGITVREYLAALLFGVWEEGEGFDGKRPFGNSSWEYELYRPLIANGFIRGTLDADGGVEELASNREAEQFVRDLISTMCGVPARTR